MPGGFDLSGFKNIVAMSQNLLPFDWREMRRDAKIFNLLRLLFLRVLQSELFTKADGVIFLTSFARNAVLSVTGPLKGKTEIIPHGVNSRFLISPRPQCPLNDFNDDRPYRVLYVSIVDKYKHQWHVAEAVAKLRSEGIPIVLDLIGPPSSGIGRLRETMQNLDPEGLFIYYHGAVSYEVIQTYYVSSDIGVFASTCETFGMILLESMSAGLPIACSNLSSMPEILGEAGVYFDPEDSDDIARTLHELINQPDLRQKFAQAAFERAKNYTWERCANETFGFLSSTAFS